jgi:hypothetical protein
MVRLMSDITQSKDIVLEGPLINEDELRIVLSSPFHPNAKLSLGEAPFDDSVSFDVLMDLLKTARESRLQDGTALRYIYLPRQVFLDDSEEPIGVMMTFDVESPALSMTYGYYGSPTSHVINVISHIHQAGDKQALILIALRKAGTTWDRSHPLFIHFWTAASLWKIYGSIFMTRLRWTILRQMPAME